MAGFRLFLKSGHAPTLLAAFVYFTYCCGVWVSNGAMAPFIKESLQLTPTQVGLMLSVPIFAGAFMRFPLGVLAQYIGRKNATLVEMTGIAVALLYGYFIVETFSDLLAMGVLLGIAGASFGVALSLGAGSFPPQYKGLAMGLVGAGNVGTSIAAVLAPQLAQLWGWKTVYGLAAAGLIVPIVVMVILAREPDDVDKHAAFSEHIACLFEKDGWAFSAIYAMTFGGFIGLITFLPTYYYDQFSVSKVQAGQLTMLVAFMGAALRVVGGWISDHWGGINTLTAVLVIVCLSLLACGFTQSSLVLTTLLMLLCFGALGAGNGAVFQLVPLRWPLSTAVAGSMIGEVGALGGGLIPNAMGFSKQYLGTYLWGFVLLAALALCVLAMMRWMQIRWTRTWAEKGGRARTAVTSAAPSAPSTTKIAA